MNQHLNTILLTVFLFMCSALRASNSLPHKLIIYKMQVENTQNRLITGYLKNMAEEEIIYSGTPIAFGMPARTSDKTIPLDQIGIVRVKRKDAVGRTALFVGLGGLTAGVLWGLIEGSDPPGAFFRTSAGAKALIGGFGLSLAGAAVGAGIGAVVHKRFVINGNKEKFQQMKGTLLQKVYGSPSPKQ
ncbi:MAG: hypothetical protein ICV51_14350 [Flavisolibacter sp.]|nr:hypothetical protein [Flavisolibacter sp.]MBD0376798.1 hypothetical protein [Flavisolibacter sp.]